MEKNKEQELIKKDPQVVDHYIFAILLLSSYYLSGFIILLFNSFFLFLSNYGNEFYSLTVPDLIRAIVMVLLIRIITKFYHEFNVEKIPKISVIIIPILILIHPFTILFSNNQVQGSYLFTSVSNFRFSFLFYIILSNIIYVVASYYIALILTNQKRRTGTNLDKYLIHMPNEIFIFVCFILVLLEMITSLISNAFEFFELTYIIKIALFYLFFQMTLPEIKEVD